MWTIIYIIAYLAFCSFLATALVILSLLRLKYQGIKFESSDICGLIIICFFPIANFFIIVLVIGFLYEIFIEGYINIIFKKIDEKVNKGLK